MYKKLLLIFILLICTIVLFNGCSNKQSLVDNSAKSTEKTDEIAKEEKTVDIEKNNEVKEDNLESTGNNSVQLRADSKYTLYPGPQPDSLSVDN